MEKYFKDLTSFIKSNIENSETFTCTFCGEETDFCRFSQGKIRQSGSVSQFKISLRLIQDKKSMSENITLSLEQEEDKKRLSSVIKKMRPLIQLLPDDPYLKINQDVSSTSKVKTNKLPPWENLITQVLKHAKNLDFVGIYAGGSIYRGFANSFGQTNWDSSYTFNLDWSVYLKGVKAVKQSYAGYEWDENLFARKLKEAKEQLEVLRKPAKSISPGAYRVYLSPAAMEEILSIMSWGGFSRGSLESKDSPLLKLWDKKEKLSPMVSLTEATSEGTSPNFNNDGYLKPEKVNLIENGLFTNALTSTRTSEEYKLTSNGTGPNESPDSLFMNPGKLSQKDILKELGTGIYINNLWYLNFSDRGSCKITGMTRFASFWVENGKIIAPLNVMRFDESAYRMLGENLVALTREREMLLNAGTYEERSTNSSCLPGALIKDFQFTL